MQFENAPNHENIKSAFQVTRLKCKYCARVKIVLKKRLNSKKKLNF